MKITADKTDKGWAIELSGAPANAVAELRIQNTLSGVVGVQYLDVAADGTAAIAAPTDFGQHSVFTAHLLTENNKDQLLHFAYVYADPNRLIAQCNDSVGASPAKMESVAATSPKSDEGDKINV